MKELIYNNVFCLCECVSARKIVENDRNEWLSPLDIYTGYSGLRDIQLNIKDVIKSVVEMYGKIPKLFE